MTKRKVSGHLSKSLFTRGHQCHKSLWLHKHQPELKDEADEDLQARFRSGHEIGKLAQGFFPGGVEVPYDGLSYPEQLAMTRNLIEEGRETIYEATFQHDGVFVKVDVLHRGAAGWEMFEVKGATNVEEVHRFDAALQLYVLIGAGFDVEKVAIVHIDNTYTRRGDLEVQKLFKAVDITADVREMQPNIASEIADMRAMLDEEMPVIDIGPQCDKPYTCDFHGHCWQHVPEDSVFDLRERGVDKFALYGKGIVRQADIPLDIHHEFLAQPGIDPRAELTERLLGQIPEGACLIAWNQKFEKGILRGLAEHFPDKAERIARLLESFRDPMSLFQSRSVYLWQQKGSYSIKAVLPHLVPALNYDGLDVANGDMAMAAYRAMAAAQDPQELARIRQALLEYCGLDTLAMVRIVEKLRELAQ